MKLIFTRPFIRDYQNLPAFIQTLADKQLELLLKDPNTLLYILKRLGKKKDYGKEELQKGFVFLFRLSPWTRKIPRGLKKEKKWYFLDWYYAPEGLARLENMTATYLCRACLSMSVEVPQPCAAER